MIQSGVLRIFRMAVRGVCSLSALPVCFVSLLVRPVLSALSALSCSVLLCPALSARPSARLSIRSAVSPPVLLFHLFCPLVQPSVCPFVHSFGCSVSCSSVLSARPSACFVSPSLRSFVPVRSVRSVRFVRLPRPSICPFRSGAAEFYSADFAKCFVFSLRDDFSVPDF
mgnify:CR=1 FL=1|jgi:hypothetical protein